MKKAAKGQRSDYCKQCRKKYGGLGQRPLAEIKENPMRALYVRVPGKGFVRIGWIFEECRHVLIDAGDII